MMNPETKVFYDRILAIVKRAQRMGIAAGSQSTQFMDMEIAAKQFDLRLDLMLEADDQNFAHDFCGVQAHMDREKCQVVDCFLPRFSGVYHPVDQVTGK